jgi:hypothetical protein
VTRAACRGSIRENLERGNVATPELRSAEASSLGIRGVVAGNAFPIDFDNGREVRSSPRISNRRGEKKMIRKKREEAPDSRRGIS